jgi:DnaK suppressor protein
MQKRNDLDFDEFEKILKERLLQIEDNIAQLRSELDGLCNNDDINDVEDLSSLGSISKKDNTILHQQENELKETIHALAKIRNGTFGICEKSADPIPVERLRINPIARCKVIIED